MVEWAYYFQAPPFGVTPATPEAKLWSVSYPLFHWGLMGWSLYVLPGVAIAYSYYVRGAKSLRLSDACEPVIGRHAKGAWDEASICSSWWAWLVRAVLVLAWQFL